MSDWTADSVLFPALQAVLIVFALVVAIPHWLRARRAGRGGVTFQITRSDTSLSRFYGTYATINGLLAAVCLTVDAAKDHRIFWVFIDTAIVVYVCLLNPWFRNLLVTWTVRLKTIEKA
jgi:hypothetical protein